MRGFVTNLFSGATLVSNKPSISAILKKALLEERPSQLEMIVAVEGALTHKKILCIEAPTGTGKTLSYCLGAYRNRKEKQPLVISTATVTLQEQIIKKDLPLLEKMLGEKINYAIAKGRRRYVCHLRLHNAVAQPDFLTSSTEFERLYEALDLSRWDGDRDSLEHPVAEPAWSSISTDAAGCAGNRCAFYEDCVFFKAKKRCHAADIVVTNHSLLLSDLELGGGALLPSVEDSVYVIDECHHLPEKALSHFARSAPVLSALEWLSGLEKAVVKLREFKIASEHDLNQIMDMTKPMAEFVNRLNFMLKEHAMKFQGHTWRVSEAEVSLFQECEPMRMLANTLGGHCQSVLADLEKQMEKQGPALQEDSVLSTALSNFSFLSARVSNFSETWNLFFSVRKDKEAPLARWFSVLESKANDNAADFVCQASPITAAADLKLLFWDKIKNGAILCSATVRALGKFDDYLRRTGLNKCDSVETKSIVSPFDYQHSVLLVPAMKSQPEGSSSEHLAEVIQLLPKLILKKHGTLVLFTSKAAMEAAFAAMPMDIVNDILMQGARGRGRLIEQHKARIDQGRRSILFGLESFAEGVDLPAKYCEHVVIHKLPFAVPSDPIELTRSEWLAANHMNAFNLVTLPATSIKLTQYVGRLIRHENDRGIVTILDKRLYTKSYGKQLLENLPPFRRILNQPLVSIDKLL